jgi:glycine hydroxymethyltransferase
MKDKIIQNLILKESKRQNDSLDLIASENIVSPDILQAVGSPLTNKYSEGYPGKRYYPGNIFYDQIENIARERALKLFHLNPKIWDVNVQPYSGSPANLAVYTALLEPGQKLMGMALSSGGHLTHGHKVSATGKFWESVQYGVDLESGIVDFEEVRSLAKKHRPKIIVSGFTAYPRKIDFKKFGQIAKEVGAYHMADISHIAGLVAAGVHPSPFKDTDVVTTTTHKTLRGPRGAMIFTRKDRFKNVGDKKVSLAELVDKAVFPGLQGGPHNNVTAAKAIAFFEATQPSFILYAKQIVANSKALARALNKRGFKLISGGSDNHLILADVRPLNLDGMSAEKRLEEVGIIANRNTIPGDTSPFKPSGLRIGTASLTTRGMKETEMDQVAELIYQALTGKNVKKEVTSLAHKFSAERFLPK